MHRIRYWSTHRQTKENTQKRHTHTHNHVYWKTKQNKKICFSGSILFIQQILRNAKATHSLSPFAFSFAWIFVKMIANDDAKTMAGDGQSNSIKKHSKQTKCPVQVNDYLWWWSRKRKRRIKAYIIVDPYSHQCHFFFNLEQKKKEEFEWIQNVLCDLAYWDLIFSSSKFNYFVFNDSNFSNRFFFYHF